MNIALEPILLIIPFLLTGVWVVLYRSRTVRVDIYHHNTQNAQPETHTAIGTHSNRYIVINEQRRIEVSK